MDVGRQAGQRGAGAILVLLLTAGLVGGCSARVAEEGSPAPTAPPREVELAREFLIVDTHIDVPYRLERRGEGEEAEDVSRRTEKGDFDYPRAVEGGLDAAFMSIYVPAKLQGTDEARELADGLIDLVEGLIAAAPGKFAAAHSPEQVRQNFAAGKISLPMGMENGAPIGDDLANLEHFYNRGVRYITLTHSEDNQFGDSSYAETGTWQGLSPLGEELIAEMNRLGMMVDISHVADETFDAVMDITRAPAIASHSGARKFTPGFERNMDDRMIRRLAEGGGVIQINFGSAFVGEESNKRAIESWAAIREFAASNGLEGNDPQVAEFRRKYRQENPPILVTVAEVADHIEHVANLVGIDHVGLGSDYDGVGETTPIGLEDVSKYPNLIAELQRRGFSAEDIRKVCGENLMRVWTEVERVAAEMAAEASSGG